MPLSHDVALALSHEPKFPDLCPGCGAKNPGDLIRIARRRHSLVELVYPLVLLFRRSHAVLVPACRDCSARLTRQRWLRFATFVAVGTAAAMLIWPWVKSFGLTRGWRKIVFAALLLLAMTPMLAWHVLRPPIVDITVDKKSVEFEFARLDYAQEFARLNDSVVT